MKTQSFSSLLALVFVFAALITSGCDSVNLDDSAPELEAPSERNNPRLSTASMYKFSDSREVGTSALRRGAEAVVLDIDTSELEPGYAYTVWWVVFDEPSACTDLSCGADDVAAAMAGGPNLADLSIIGAADGSVIPANGTARYRGMLEQNDDTGAVFGDGMDNPATAEIHYVIRSHGPAIPGLIKEQTTTFNGGCLEGQGNEGQCVNVQFAIHKAESL